MGQLLAQAEPVKLVAHKLPRADALGQVPDADLVGQGEEGAGHLLVAGEAGGGVPGQHVTDQTTFFFYDAGGNRTRTLYPNGTNVYTPYPDYEEEVPSGANPTITQRVTFSANGQVAVGWKKVGSTTAMLYSLHTNHLGSVVHMGDSSGARIDSGYAMYEPFGAFSNTPPGMNPSVTDRGFTGHRQNNTGTYDLKLIYMNARYYHPQLGRFVSPDTIVPEPTNPQSYNRYAYGLNNPVKYVDPSGHCFLLPPVDTTACAIAAGVAGSAISTGTYLAGVGAVLALTTAVAEAINPDFSIANLIGDAVEGAENFGREMMKNIAGPSASGNPNDLDPNKNQKPTFVRKQPISESQSNKPWARYQKSVTGKDYEEVYRLANGEEVRLDSITGKYVVDAKWTGRNNPTGWAKSP